MKIKYAFLLFLIFLFGAQTTYAKTELVLSQYQVYFSIEQNQSFQRLEKEVQPNIGFLQEKFRFVMSEGVSAQNNCNFSECFVGYLANAGGFISHVDIQQSLSTIIDLKSTNKLTKSIGNATDGELAAIHKYTENGGVLNSPMRNGSETVLGPVSFTDFQSQVYQHTISGLVKLRQTNRLVTGTVIRGRTYSLNDFNTLFNNGTVNVPLKGMVSCTKNEAVAVDFLTTSGQNISGSKVKVVMKIKSKNGVDIDDMSDWGVNLVNERHPGALIQEEVLLEEGMFKKLSEPKKILNPDGTPKKDIDGTEYWEVELEELGTPLRNIN